MPPCSLCWYQRICLYPLTLVIAVGIVLRDGKLVHYALPLVLAGLGIAVYHNLLYYGVIPESLSPCTAGVPCSSRQIDWLGFIGIPLMSLAAFVALLLTLLAHRRAQRPGVLMKKDVVRLAGVAAVLVAVLLVAAAFYTRSQKQEQEAKVAQQVAASTSGGGPGDNSAFVRPHSRSQGPKDAKVTVVEFLDPECESCRAMYPMVKHLLGRIRQPRAAGRALHAVSPQLPAGGRRAGGCRRAGALLGDAGELFLNQPRWGDHHAPRPEVIPQLAEQLGLDMEAYRRSVATDVHRKVADTDRKDGESLGVTGTPTFFVNGKRLENLGYEHPQSPHRPGARPLGPRQTPPSTPARPRCRPPPPDRSPSPAVPRGRGRGEGLRRRRRREGLSPARLPLLAVQQGLELGQVLLAEAGGVDQPAHQGQRLAAEQPPHDVLEGVGLVDVLGHQRLVAVAAAELLAAQDLLLLEDAQDGRHGGVGQRPLGRQVGQHVGHGPAPHPPQDVHQLELDLGEQLLGTPYLPGNHDPQIN